MPVPAGELAGRLWESETGSVEELSFELLLTCCSGIEDGQTVRMPVGKKEIFITFRVSISRR